MDSKQFLKCGAAAGALLAALMAADASYAQSSGALDEVVVTAERREINVQHTPIAVTAVAGDTLAKSNVVSVVDLNGMVPSLTVSRNNGLQRVIAIRGVGYETAQNISSQPGVAFFIDNVYIANNIATGLNLVDVNRLEVLRGPQSTLYAQSATGGVINMITNQPVLGKVAGSADLSLGNYDLVKANASLNVPIGDTLAIRGSAQSFQHDGFATVPGLGGYDLDNSDDYTAKVSALWKPIENFSAELTYQHFKERGHGAAQKNLLDRNPDARIIGQDYAGSSDLTFKLAYLTLKYDLPFAQLKFTGSHQDMKSLQKADNDRSDFATIGAFDIYPRSDILNKADTQEVTLTSTTDGAFDWIVGAFFMQQDARQITLEYNGKVAPPGNYPIITAVPPTGLPPFLAYAADASLTRKSKAGFAQGTWHATPALRITAGARYSDDSFSNSNSASFAAPVYFTHKDTQTTGKVEVDYDFTPSVMGYATLSRGYKPGGVNINTRPVLVGRGFEAETVNSYEVGAKTRWLDNRLQLNGAAFYYDYKNFQYQEEDPIPYQGGVANIPKTKIYGAELEGAFLVTPSLRLTGNVTALDGKFEGTYFALDALAANQANAIAAARGLSVFAPAGQALRAAAVQNVDGNTPPKMPKISGTLAVEGTYHLPSGHSVVSRLEAVYRGSYQYRIFNTAGIDTVPAYTLLNLNIDYKMPDSPFALSMTVTNLTDEDAINSRFSDPFGVGSTSNTYVPPRQIYGTIKYSF